MQARKTVQGKIVEKKIVCRTDEQIKLVQKLVKENCSSVRGFNTYFQLNFNVVSVTTSCARQDIVLSNTLVEHHVRQFLAILEKVYQCLARCN